MAYQDRNNRDRVKLIVMCEVDRAEFEAFDDNLVECMDATLNEILGNEESIATLNVEEIHVAMKL